MDTAATNDAVWQEFQHNLAECLADMDEGDSLIISDTHSGLFVQFSGDGRGRLMRAEAASKLFRAQDVAMRKLGWNYSDDFRRAAGNYFVDDECPGDYSRLAELAVRTLREVYGVDSPCRLEYKAFAIEGPEIRFPSLKIRRERAN